MERFTLNETEVDEIETLLTIVAKEYASPCGSEFLDDVAYWGHSLPRRLCQFLMDFKYKETGRGGCVIKGLQVDQKEIGATPEKASVDNDVTLTRENYLFLMVSAVLGDPYGWATQQNARILHDILPVKGMEGEQISLGSNELITLHCEDAFHEHRADYVGLMCLRNPDNIATTYSYLLPDDLPDEVRECLFNETFKIFPDNSHLPENNELSDSQEDIEDAYALINKELEEGIDIRLLFGDLNDPYLRLDPYFMDTPEDPRLKQAYQQLCQCLEQNTQAVSLEPGDILFVDNYRAVHGRKGFKARFDGTDRWLRRVNITRDLRRSRACRKAVNDRIVL